MIRRWRWRLARLVAPEPIMFDQLAGEDGVFVVMREQGTVAMLRADRFRLRTRLHIPKAWDRGKMFGELDWHFGTTHFAGTVRR